MQCLSLWSRNLVIILLCTLGYSNGSLKDVDEKSVNSGGQCKEGLKMIVVIGDVPLSDYSPRYSGL